MPLVNLNSRKMCYFGCLDGRYWRKSLPLTEAVQKALRIQAVLPPVTGGSQLLSSLESL